MKRVKEKFWIVGMATVVVLVGWSVLSNTLNKDLEKQILAHIETQLSVLESTIDSINKTYEDFAAYIVEKVAFQPEILEIMQKANQSDPETQSQLRQRLYELLKDDYDLMQRFSYRQLHFHLRNGDSFLRFHAPDVYGDNLLSVRESIRIANVEKRYAFGFEEGRIFNGYRFVYPLFYHNQHVGSVEVSISLSATLKQLSRLYPEFVTIFVLKREVVETTVFQKQQTNYSPSPLSDDYVVDNKFLQEVSEFEDIDTFFGNAQFLGLVKAKALPHLATEQRFGVTVAYQGKTYLVLFLPLQNIKGQNVGYFVSIVKDNGHLLELQQQNRINKLLLSLLGLFAIVIAMFLSNDLDRIQREANSDPLTGAYNRRYLVNVVQKKIYRKWQKKKRGCVIVLDLDYFKKINDVYGHSVGDSVLIELVEQTRKYLRASDLLVRWGGEEFIVLLEDSDQDIGQQVAERLRRRVEDHTFREVGKITISLGVACLRESDKSLFDLINRADEALYKAKANGRNCVVCNW